MSRFNFGQVCGSDEVPPSSLGFLTSSPPFTCCGGRYVALCAFDEGREADPEVPVAFIIAEVSRLDETRVGGWVLGAGWAGEE